MTGRGSWTPLGGTYPATIGGRVYGYYQWDASMKILVGQQALTDPKLDPEFKEYRAVTAGVAAIQTMLNREIAAGLVVDGQFGKLTSAAVVNAQGRYGLISGYTPGRVGPTFATRLFRALVLATEHTYAIPNRALAGVLCLESENFDPGAVGTVSDLDDGLAQFHVDGSTTWWNRFYGKQEQALTHQLAFDPLWAIEQAARRMGYYRARYADKGGTLQEACSIAQHNAPGWADIWYVTGTAPNPTIAAYVTAVQSRAAAY